MAERDKSFDGEDLQAPPRLVEALKNLHQERLFIPPTVDEQVLRAAREHLQGLERPDVAARQWLSWAAMAACLALTVWLAALFGGPPRPGKTGREDINHDGRIDILDAFALARNIETGATIDPRWDINGDGRVDRADVIAIANRAVSLGRFSAALMIQDPPDIRLVPSGVDGVRQSFLFALRKLSRDARGQVASESRESFHEPGLSSSSSSSSWTSLAAFSRTRTRTIRFIVPVHGHQTSEAFHEPPPLPVLSPARSGGEGGRRPGEGAFMVPMHSRRRKAALHEPPESFKEGRS